MNSLKNKWVVRNYMGLAHLAEIYFFPLFVLFIRIWIARIFWFSGLTKISNWPATVYLFENDYKVPYLPVELAAYLATTIELVCPILLISGFVARFATIPLLVMTWVIALTYPGYVEHTYWAILLGVILLYGPGCVSVDYWIRRKLTTP